MAATTRLIRLRMREVLARPWIGVCVPLVSSLAISKVIFANVIELSSIYFSSISKQIQQRAPIGKIFARWHLAIAIISNIIYWSKLLQLFI